MFVASFTSSKKFCHRSLNWLKTQECINKLWGIIHRNGKQQQQLHKTKYYYIQNMHKSQRYYVEKKKTDTK